MSGHRYVAVPSALALIAGSWLGLHATWCPAKGAVLLLALGGALRGAWGWRTAFLAAGLAASSLESGQRMLPDQDRPVTLSLRVTGSWRLDEQGWRAPARGEWLRQGRTVQLWTDRLWVVLSAANAPPQQDALRLQGYLRRAPPLANGFSASLGPWIMRVKSPRLITTSGSRGASANRAMRWMGGILQRWVEGHLSHTGSGRRRWSETLVRVLMLGQTDALPDAVARGLRAAGLAHLVALSGLHVGLLAGFVLMASTGARPGLRFLLATLMVGGYVCLAGVRPSLVRSTCMLFAMFGGWLLRRPPQATNTLGWVAAGMVLLQPSVTRDLGFQLTVSATAGILVLAPRFQLRLVQIPIPLRQALSVSLGANIAALPWTLSVFHLATPLSPLWNLAAVPWAAVTLVLVFCMVLSWGIVPPAARLFEPLVELMGAPLEMLGNLPPEVLFSSPVGMDWWQAALLSSALVALVLCRTRVRLGIVSCLMVICLVWRSDVPADPELMILDVGQGDAILLRDGAQAILVDGGGWTRSDIAQRILVPTLARLGIRHLSAVVLTHPDIDHCSGLLALTSYVPIDHFYTAVGWHRDDCVVGILGRPRLEAVPLWRGVDLKMSRWRLKVLHPGAGTRQGRNNRSVVLLAETSNRRVLLTGDLEASGEREILRTFNRAELGKIDVLKVGHHGSKTSTSPNLLFRTLPALALISCGMGNRYGHPSNEILERLRDNEVRVLRTDLHGAIRVVLPVDGPMRIHPLGLPRRE